MYAAFYKQRLFNGERSGAAGPDGAPGSSGSGPRT